MIRSTLMSDIMEQIHVGNINSYTPLIPKLVFFAV